MKLLALSSRCALDSVLNHATQRGRIMRRSIFVLAVFALLSDAGQVRGTPFEDNFDDGSIDGSLWVYGGTRNSYHGAPDGSWTYSHQESGDNLQMRVQGPASGVTYGAGAWIRTAYDYNDGQSHLINFAWEPEYMDDHFNCYSIQVSDGDTSYMGYSHWAWDPNLPAPAGTTDLLWRTDSVGDNYRAWLGIGEGLPMIDPAGGPFPVPGPGRFDWSIEIDSTGIARLYDAPDATGTMRREETLEVGSPWYVRLSVVDATSSGFPAGDARLNLYSYSSEVVPELSSLIIWSVIGLGFAGIGWRRRKMT